MYEARIPKGGIAKSGYRRTLKRITFTIHTARPGVVIGKGGNEVDKIKEELKKITSKDVQINIFEIKRPELGLETCWRIYRAADRSSYLLQDAAMKQAIASAMRVGAEASKSRFLAVWPVPTWRELNNTKKAVFPCTLCVPDIDYAISEAQTVYGKIGIKVWIFKGEIYGKA